MTDDQTTALLTAARAVLKPRRLSPTVEVGSVSAALLAASGRIYTGVCIDASSSVGFCAEHSAAAAMVTAGESQVLAMVALHWDGEILAPCGRCRELIVQLDPANAETTVILSCKTVTLRQLLPDHWLLDGPAR